MNPTWEDPIPDEDEDESSYEGGSAYGRDAIIFLIDATWEMFEENEGETPFQLSLKCARTTLTNKIISSRKDIIGVVLFGTDKSKNSRNNTDFKHIYVFHDLTEPGADRVLETEELMTMDCQNFTDKFGHSYDFSLADALWVCSIMFANCKYTLAHRRILLFTSTDDPHGSNPTLQLQARTKAKDLHESSIDIDVMHIKRQNTIFDPSKFYKDIALTAEDEEYKFPDASDKFDDLLTRVRCKDHRKRPMGSLHFTLGSDVKIAFKMYKLVAPTSKSVPVKLAKETNAELVSVTNTFLGDTGEILLLSDLKKYQEYGGRKIYMSDDEVKQIRYFDDPGLLLMGFKPNSCLKSHYHLKPSVFVYPDEKAIEGSTRLSLALIIQLNKRGYVAICRLIARQNESPRFVALLPQAKQTDDHGNQMVPPGFHIVYLPFMEDIRTIKCDTKHAAPSEGLVEKSKEIIKKLQFAYHPESFENPVLQKHWRNIEALALNRDAPDEIIDYTSEAGQSLANFLYSEMRTEKSGVILSSPMNKKMPTKDVIEKRAGRLIEEFKTLLCPGAPDPCISQKFGMAGPAYGAPACKRARMDDVIPSNLQHEAATGQLLRYTVSVLKEFCRQNGIRCASKKAEIVEAIKRFYMISSSQ
ncbi:ATP-dependent DNA helicase 2 subunit 1 isoform X3 [Parasteatoda tepidariorum]